MTAGGPIAAQRHRVKCAAMMAALAITSLAGCQSREGDDRVIDLWHQMRPEDRDVLKARIAAFEGAHPGVRVRELYKETEELRDMVVTAANIAIQEIREA